MTVLILIVLSMSTLNIPKFVIMLYQDAIFISDI